MTVQSGPGTAGTRHLKTEWPVLAGLELGTSNLNISGGAALEADEDVVPESEHWGSI